MLLRNRFEFVDYLLQNLKFGNLYLYRMIFQNTRHLNLKLITQPLLNLVRKSSNGPKIAKLPHKIGFIGDGNMAKAMCLGICNRGLVDFSQIYVSSPYLNNLNTWKPLGVNITIHNDEVAEKCEIIFIAVKPHVLDEALNSLINNKDKIRNKLFVSILPGINLETLEQKIQVFNGSRIIRTMPNTPMLVGEGCTTYCPGKNVTEQDLNAIETILKVTGECEMLPENVMNAASAVASCGPAFVYLFIEALSDGGVRMGLHRTTATKFAAQTVYGAAKMVLKTEKHMGVLKDEVCSAGGITIAGIHALERGGVRGSVMDAVKAAVERSEELAKKS